MLDGDMYEFGRQFQSRRRLDQAPETTSDDFSSINYGLDVYVKTGTVFGHLEQYLGTAEFVQVNQSIAAICAALGVKPRLDYTGGNKGWIGDNPFIFLDTKKIQSTGWRAKLTIEQGILRTLRWLEANRWVYDARR